MNSSYKINFNDFNKEYDRYIKLKLENEIESLEFLSIKLNSNEIYQSFNADYGVLVGRVVANNGIGVPNAKISVFIPLTEEDEFNENIKYIYPYKTPRDKNNEGKRYNLLPRVGKIDNNTGISRPQQPFGSFPIKEEIVTNVNHLNVYKKYYKYTALTNQFGDYMIFGTPIGTQIIHMSLDITDIGEYSMTPASMVTNLGYSENLFIENNTRIKSSDDLNDLPHIETQDISVDIIPFWGDTGNYDIGITRQDFRVRTTLNSTFTIFGNVFTDGDGSMWGTDIDNQLKPYELFRINDDNNLNINTKRLGQINETIYYYPSDVSDEEIDDQNGFAFDKMLVLDKKEYSRYIEDGNFAFIVNCNRKKIVKDEKNNSIVVPHDYNGGIFTEFRGFVVVELDVNSAKMDFSDYLERNPLVGSKRGLIKPFRYKLKIPQYAPILSGSTSNTPSPSFSKEENNNTDNWRRQSYTFTGGNIYSISRYHGLSHYENSGSSWHPESNIFNDVTKTDISNVGIIKTINLEYNSYIIPAGFSGGTLADQPPIIPLVNNYPLTNEELSGYTVNPSSVEYIYYLVIDSSLNNKKIIPYNYENDGNKYFGAEWLNFSIYFPQIARVLSDVKRIQDMRSNTHFTVNYTDDFYYNENSQQIVGDSINTEFFGRSDINMMDFINVNKEDIKYFENINYSGFNESPSELKGSYKHIDNNKCYFYKGFGVDCIKFLKQIGIV